MSKVVDLNFTGYTSFEAILSDKRIIKFSDWQIADVWQKFGGSFVKSLGIALSKADGHNTLIILSAFRHYVMEYIDGFLLDNIPSNAKN